MAKPKLLLIDYAGRGYARPFADLFEIMDPVTDNTVVWNIKQADVILLTGGEDISPYLYHHHKLNRTFPSLERDRYEEIIFKIGMKEKKKFLGICRGAQFLCAMAGGQLVQHCSNHSYDHPVTTYDGQTIQMTSVHHQMMVPKDTKHQLLAWSNNIADQYIMGLPIDNKDGAQMEVACKPYPDGREPDTVWFEEVQGLGFQGHPEMMPMNAEGSWKLSKEWVQAQTRKFLY